MILQEKEVPENIIHIIIDADEGLLLSYLSASASFENYVLNENAN